MSSHELHWDQIHPELWMQVLSPARPNSGDHSDSGHIVHQLSGNLGSQAQVGQYQVIGQQFETFRRWVGT